MAVTVPPPAAAMPPASAGITPLLRTVLLCDLVESTALVERLGDARAATVLQRHDRIVQELLARSQGQLIDKADGVLALFERPVQALRFALGYQRALRELGIDLGEAISARVGIHVGDVMTWTHSEAEVLAGAKPVEVEGLAKPVAARLMGLALPGQILMSGMAQNLAQRAQAELGEDATHLRWRLHGRYRFKGVPAPMLVHEAGELGLAPFKAPPSGAKAWRELPIWRRPPVLAVEAVLVFGLAAAGVWTLLKSPPAIAFNERDWVVVADFHNLTGESLYDDALDSALRVGLEQSRYVNVLSELQVDQALQRMQRAGQPLDRQIGSELALREGAKALVLPTVADIGGRPRVTVEVVDPNSGVTVYTHMADASGDGGVVAALDDVLGEMRGDLGESLASIEKNAVPLEKATTSNLEALRAFGLGIKAYYADKTKEALDYFNRATQLDQSFAMAYLRIATVMYGTGRPNEAQKYMQLAVANKDRLTLREALLLEAVMAVFDKPASVLEKWKSLAATYPDEYRAYYNFAGFARRDAQEYEEALSFLGPALNPRFIGYASAYYEQGMLYLALDKYDEALAAFQKSDALGLGGRKGSFADAYAARRDYVSASKVLSSQQATGEPAWVLEERQSEISYPLDRGDWKSALDAANGLSLALQDAPVQVRENLELQRLVLRCYWPDSRLGADLDVFVEQLKSRFQNANAIDRRHVAFRMMAAAWVAARTGNKHLAKSVLDFVGDDSALRDYPANSDMALVARAEMAISNGEASSAVRLLLGRANAGDELYFLHAVLMRAFVGNRQAAEALQQAEWLSQHRGRAFGEPNSDGSWQPANLMESNIALLYSARLSESLGQPNTAKARRELFEKAWPDGRRMPAAIEAELDAVPGASSN